jgi:hypothetical protein
MEQKTAAEERTLSTYLSALTRIAFTTAYYWFVGLTPEENHGIEGYSWDPETK